MNYKTETKKRKTKKEKENSLQPGFPKFESSEICDILQHKALFGLVCGWFKTRRTSR